MKKIITISVFFLACFRLAAQQDPQFSQFMFNKLFMNPAYAGMREAFCMSAIGRQQWAGFDGSPRSGIFSADMKLPGYAGGIGINVLSDRLGFENNQRYNIDYSYHRELGDGVIGIGVEFGAYSKHIGPTGNDQWQSTTAWTSDPSIPSSLNKTVPDFGFGLWYQRQDLWFGISSSHLNAMMINGGQETILGHTHDQRFQMARHYFITGGCNISTLGNGTWSLRPSFLVKSDATITSFELNCIALWQNKFWGGVSWRYRDAICPMVGFQLLTPHMPDKFSDGGLKIGFAYDYTTSQLHNYNDGTFEIFLNYCIPLDYTAGHGTVRFFE
ncbi:MAG TPA: type IX secretion system membrane protein PorP/SprF [Bacteroidia bacterium]|nr:type IX secretion system membrane protein PorP/SprF [Bacteroidia bacterium]